MAQERSDLETPNQTDPASRGFVDEHSGSKVLERDAHPKALERTRWISRQATMYRKRAQYQRTDQRYP